ncbi:MAG: helix-turn-helix domain-containing protein [Actinomycetes bacterium]
MEKLLLTPEETAEVMGIGRTKVYELLRRGVLESVRIGGSRRVPTAAVEEYVRRLRGQVRELARP